MDLGNQLNSIVESIVADIKTKVEDNLSTTISAAISKAIADYDIDSLVSTLAEKALKDYLNTMEFPAHSIAAESINFDNFTLSGDYVKGGIINNFASTGIDDKASQCQLTILDNAVVVEQPIITTGIDVQGSAQVSEVLTVKELKIAGKLNEESPGYQQLIDAAKNTVLNEIAQNGLIAPKLIFNDRSEISETHLPNTLTNSNLRRVGTLEELQTRGDTLLDETLFVSRKRVGVNTLEPSYALSVWDEEIEIAINKTGKNRAFIGSHRPVNVILGAADHENISLEIDGSVTINDLRLGALPLSTASMEPNWEGRSGEIVFNDSPQIGQPIGWVCLQGTRWAKFGLIQE